MLLTILFPAILFTLLTGIFFYFHLRRSDTAKKDDEMASRYQAFILLLLADYPRARVTRIKHGLLIQSKDNRGINSISISEVQGKVIVVRSWEHASFGKRGKEWSFAMDYNQANMYTEMKTAWEQYQVGVYQNHNLMAPERKGN